MLTQTFQTFTLSGSSVALMKPGEQGTVTRVRGNDRQVHQQLTNLGLLPGLAITLEQRFPLYVIRAGQTRITLDKSSARAVYVRMNAQANP